MKALVWHGTTDIRCDSVPDPRIEHARDAIIKVTSCAICGSDLHLYDHFMPGMKSGDIMGHETMGEVVEVGPAARQRSRWAIGSSYPSPSFAANASSASAATSRSARRTNRNKDLADKAFGHTTAGLFGYTHLTGGYPGGQAEYLRVPFADTTHIKVPERHPRREAAVSVRHLPDRLAGGRAVRHPADRHGGDLGLRPGRPDDDPQRRPARRQAGHRDRPPAGAPVDGQSRRRDHHQLRRGKRRRAAERADRRQGSGEVHRRGRHGGACHRARSTPCTTAPNRP